MYAKYFLQLFVSYNSFEFVGMTAEERINNLQKAKFFTCECEACKNNYSFKFELDWTQIPDELKDKVVKNPADKENLWRFLKFVLKMHKGPSLEAKTLELMIINAYLGSNFLVNLKSQL